VGLAGNGHLKMGVRGLTSFVDKVAAAWEEIDLSGACLVFDAKALLYHIYFRAPNAFSRPAGHADEVEEVGSGMQARRASTAALAASMLRSTPPPAHSSALSSSAAAPCASSSTVRRTLRSLACSRSLMQCSGHALRHVLFVGSSRAGMD